MERRCSGAPVFSVKMTVSLRAGTMLLGRQLKERFMNRFFLAVATASILILLMITVFLFMEGVPLFAKVSISDFIFGHYWYPTSDPPAFGIYPLIIGSLAVTFISAVISIPLGVMTAVYLAEIARPRFREWVKPIVELLAALPSVVIGFFGMVVMAPLLQNVLGVATGLNLFNAALMLAFMSVPTICSLSEDAIYSVPNNLKEASLALGATHWETIIRVVLPASISGISTAVILGMSRAIGETMVVLMVAGGAAMVPGSLFDPVRPLPASIAAEMAEAPFRGDHYYALFATGIVLFLFTLAFNIIADQVAHRYRQVGDATL
jgi:phosphate transport system permease protein